MNKIYKFIGVLFITALLIAIPMLCVLSMCYAWDPFIKMILIIFNIGEFLSIFITLFYKED